MKPSNLLVVILIFMFGLSGCNTLTVTSESIGNFDLSQARTFSLVDSPESSYGKATDNAIRSAIASSMTAGGLKQLDNNEAADILVAFQVTNEERTSDVTIYRGWRDYALRSPEWDGPVGTARTTQRTYTIGSLAIGVFDGKSKELKWQSVGSREKNPSRQREPDQQRINETVKKILADFPLNAN